MRYCATSYTGKGLAIMGPLGTSVVGGGCASRSMIRKKFLARSACRPAFILPQGLDIAQDAASGVSQFVAGIGQENRNARG